MDLVEGLNGNSFSFDDGGDYNDKYLASTRRARARALQDLASIQVKLAAYQSSIGGHLGRLDPPVKKEFAVVGEFGVKGIDKVDDDTFDAGEFLLYRSPQIYYEKEIKDQREFYERNVKGRRGSAESNAKEEKLMNIIESTIPRLCHDNDKFYLAFLDLGGHNTIHSEDGELKGVIDVGSLMFVPMHVAVQPPGCFGLTSIEWINPNCWLQDTDELSRYSEVLRMVGKDYRVDHVGKVFSHEVHSHSTVVVSALRLLREPPSDYKKKAMETLIARHDEELRRRGPTKKYDQDSSTPRAGVQCTQQ